MVVAPNVKNTCLVPENQPLVLAQERYGAICWTRKGAGGLSTPPAQANCLAGGVRRAPPHRQEHLCPGMRQGRGSFSVLRRFAASGQSGPEGPTGNLRPAAGRSNQGSQGRA